MDYDERKQFVQAFLDNGKYDIHVLLDENIQKNYLMRDTYQVKGIPAKFIIDKHGQVRYAFTGFSKGTDDAAVEEVKQMVEQLL